MASRLHLQAKYTAGSGELFEALMLTLAFRRWQQYASGHSGQAGDTVCTPGSSQRYRHAFGSVLRIGRIVEVIRPVGCSLREVLHDPPCRVGLRIRWRIEPVGEVVLLRLQLRYRLNHAAFIRRKHWDARLDEHFRRQFAFVALNLERIRSSQVPSSGTGDRRRSCSPGCTDTRAYRDAG